MTVQRRLLSVPLILVILVATPLAVSGFWSDRALDDSTVFGRQMQAAWRSGDLQPEFRQMITDATTEQVNSYFQVTGPGQNPLADTAQGYAETMISNNLDSPAFLVQWGVFNAALHKDLATIIKGGTPEVTSVDGSVIAVDISPLVSALLTGPIGQIAQGLLGDELSVQHIDVGYDLEPELASLGRLWSARWWLALAAAAAFGALLLVWRPALHGAAAGLLAGAVGSAGFALWRTAGGGDPPAPEPTALSEAFSAAMVSGWVPALVTASVVLALLAIAAVLVERFRPRSALPVQGDPGI